MARTRAYRSPWLWAPAVLLSGLAQGAALFTYEVTRPTPTPYLTIHLDDAAASWDFDTTQQDPYDGKTSLKVVGPKISGFRIAVKQGGNQDFANAPYRFELPEKDAWLPVTITSDDGTEHTTMVEVKAGKETMLDVDYAPPRGKVIVTRAGQSAPLLTCEEPECSLKLEPGTKVTLTAQVTGDNSIFGGFTQLPMRTPKALVPLLGDPLASCKEGDAVSAAAAGHLYDCTFAVGADTDVAAEFAKKPEQVNVAFTPQELGKLIRPLQPPPPPPPIDAEKLENKPLVAIAPPPPPPPQIKPPDPQKPPEAKAAKPPDPQQQQLTAVEVKDDKDVKDKPPPDTKFISDKNRDVAEEMRAQKTNLDKESEGKSDASAQSDDHTSAEIGGPKDQIRQLEDTKPTTDKHIQETDHSGDKQTAQGEIRGEGGDNGDDGTGEREPGALSMRGIGGRGPITDHGNGKKLGKKGVPGINSSLAFQDYERIEGKEKVDAEREVAARKMSAKKGRWERKLDAIRSSLENFVPDVRVGNQTALKTRAAPYALYLARMHRRIHELWGFGFLEALDSRGANDPLNDMNLWVNLEISVNPDGTLHKITIVKTSGQTEFDVAAVDTVLQAGPYDQTPEAIRSVDGRIYLRWGFYRGPRQCGTFNAEPYILDSVPDDNGQGVLDDGAMVANVGHVPGRKRPAPVVGKGVTPDDGLSNQKGSPDSSVTDKQAQFAAGLFTSAYSTAEVDKMVKLSVTPFYAAGQVAAQTSADLKDMYGNLIVESGSLKDWKLLTPDEYAPNTGLPAGNFVLRVTTEKATFAVVLTQTKSGEYRATQLAR